jgi:predicted nucleic acid-binding protein
MITLWRCCEVLLCAWVLALPVGCAFDDEFECRTLQSVDRQVADIETLPVDDEAAQTWAQLRIHLAETGRRARINDLWIAAIAASRALLVVTQDDDFAGLDGAAKLTIIRV